ncbi:hypothetical protein ACFQ1L_41810 [Phytohabitans flavus]|nr:hypothetical protein [Phytohabitans flavus]
MAILLDFEKVREDQREVEYTFGYPEMDRRLVIEKASQRGTSLDGNEDHNYWAIVNKVTRLFRSEASWPERGVYAA